MFFSHLLLANTAKEADDMLNVQLDVASSILSNQIGPPTIETGRNKLRYEPNVSEKTGISLGYRNLGLGFSFQSSTSNEDLKGESSTQDYSLRLLGKNSFEVSYQKAEGFYLLDSENEFGSGFYRKPNMVTSRTAIQWIHNYHHDDISLPASFNYSGWQKKSGWGFLTFINANRATTRDESTFIPSSLASSYTEFADITAVERSSAGLGIGLAGALVWRGFQLATLITVGSSYNSVRYEKVSKLDEKISGSSSTSNVYINLGYNGSRNQFGLSFFNNSNVIARNSEKFEQSRTDVRAFYGYRFSDVNLGRLANTVSSWLD